MDLNKNKFFRISRYVSNILCSVFIICLAIQFICMLWLSLMPDKLSDFFEKFQVWRPYITHMYPYSRAKAELCASMLTYAFAVCFSYNASRVFLSLEKSEKISGDRIKKVSVLALVCSVVIPSVHNVAFDIFTSGSFSKMGIDFGLLFVGIVLLAISFCVVKNKE